MATDSRISRTGREYPVLEPARLGNAPQNLGKAIAHTQIEAAKATYKAEYSNGVRGFVQDACDETPEELAKYTHLLRVDGARSALVGFLWRFAWFGGVGFVGSFSVGLGLAVSVGVLVSMVPFCCLLVMT